MIERLKAKGDEEGISTSGLHVSSGRSTLVLYTLEQVPDFLCLGFIQKHSFVIFFFFRLISVKENRNACASVCVCVCVFIKLHITAQSGPVILVILCHSH